ncbi:hypothetical protein FNV43_RR12515 [Rhamnella rubrinervis]|uniref:Uncharacterized protein n=1 Tax=Rhamnella rubrinervis TaxID=2594499 RepID=A0A8K0H8D4_9ROSA|nr:hypothetical protein FNV43_RR12515 [Rhamnella rubrinervis]
MEYRPRISQLDGIIRTRVLRMKTQFNDYARLRGVLDFDGQVQSIMLGNFLFKIDIHKAFDSMGLAGDPLSPLLFGIRRFYGGIYLGWSRGSLCRFPPRNSSSQANSFIAETACSCFARGTYREFGGVFDAMRLLILLVEEALLGILTSHVSDFGRLASWKAVPTDGGRLCLINFGDYLELRKIEPLSYLCFLDRLLRAALSYHFEGMIWIIGVPLEASFFSLNMNSDIVSASTVSGLLDRGHFGNVFIPLSALWLLFGPTREANAIEESAMPGFGYLDGCGGGCGSGRIAIRVSHILREEITVRGSFSKMRFLIGVDGGGVFSSCILCITRNVNGFANYRFRK